MIQSFLFAVSKIINGYLHLDPESPERLQQLRGKVIAVELAPLQLSFHCHFNDNGLLITTSSDQTDAKIVGTPLQLLNVMIDKENRQQFFADDIKISGDAEIANQLVQLFDDARIDIENELARIVGDTTAYHISNLINNTKTWLRTTVDVFTDDVKEYTHEEAQWFPPNEALTNFFNEVDELRMDVDRLEKHFQKIKTQVEKGDDSTATTNDET